MQNTDRTTGAIMATLVLAGLSSTAAGHAVDEDQNGYLILQVPAVVPEIMELFARMDDGRGRLDVADPAARTLQG
jgi:hypothetical protein